MPRPSAVIREELDAVNRKRRAIDKQIEDRRRELYSMKDQVDSLEREYQAAVALEQQAAIEAQTQAKH